jgi:hypothetical protein
MSRNPYAPPTASVADPPSALLVRPVVIRRAVLLLWISFGVGILGGLSHAGPEEPWTIMLGFMAAFGSILAWLIVQIARRRNWARITYLILAVLGDVDSVSSWQSSRSLYHVHPSVLVLDVAGLVLEAIGLCLLFTKAANAWYRARPET